MPKGYRRRFRPPPRTNLRPAPPPPPSITITFDDPEDEDSFKRLPRAAQEEMRKAWAAQDARVERREGFSRTSRARSMLQAAGIFAFTETAMAVASWPHSLAAVIVGAGVGWWWHRVGAGRMQCMTSSIAPYVALRIVFATTDRGVDYILASIMAVGGFLMLLGLTSLVGYVREMRRSDDLDY